MMQNGDPINCETLAVVFYRGDSLRVFGPRSADQWYLQQTL